MLKIALGLLELSSDNEDKKLIAQCLLGQPASCPSHHIQAGHSAKIGAFRVMDNGQVWARLDFQIIGKMQGWVKVEELKSC